MKPESWQQIDQLLKAALTRPPAEHAAFLSEACAGDDMLRQDVESRLRSDELATKLVTEQPVKSLVGQRLGHYKILSALGAGGMGEVYLAQDARMGRKVALKMLPTHFTSNADRVRRFAQEGRAGGETNR